MSFEMNNFLVESKWEKYLKETLSELIDVRPNNPLYYLYEKYQVN